MKVLETAKTPEGYDIQVEDWTKDYSCFKTLSIGAYPIAQRTSDGKWIEGGKPFRLDINRFNTNEEVHQAYADLISGVKTLKDFTSQFWNGEKDCYLLGL